MKKYCIFIVILFLSVSACRKEPLTYQTKNVIVIIMDGARYSETWGDSARQYIPQISKYIACQGVTLTHFYNNGITSTVPGHVSLTTGVNQSIANDGSEIPARPGFIQYWLQVTKSDTTKAWIVTSKDKLAVLGLSADSTFPIYKPSVNCGINGLSTGVRDDSTTLSETEKALSVYHPNLALISFRDPDYTAHQGNYDNYLNAIRRTDSLIYRLWEFINSDPYYQGTTTVFITNDHGRHTDGLADGFISHGDDCDGCRHIMLFAAGPDFKKDVVGNIPYELNDISVTIATMLNYNMPVSKGKLMLELFK